LTERKAWDRAGEEADGRRERSGGRAEREACPSGTMSPRDERAFRYVGLWKEEILYDEVCHTEINKSKK